MNTENDLNKVGGFKFKLKNYMAEWLVSYSEKIRIEKDVEMFGLLNVEKVTKLLFFKLGYWEKYNEIQDLIKKFKQLKFKGDQIEDDFSKFFELDEKIEETVDVITEMLEKFKSLRDTMLDKKDVDYLKDTKDFYQQSNKNERYILDIAGGCCLNMNKLIHLIKDLQDLSNSLQYNLLNLYITHKDILSHILKQKKVEKNNISVKDENINRIFKNGVIYTVFSRASNFDIEKELYYERRDLVKSLTKNIKKENRDENSLEQKLNNKEFNNNYSITYKNVYLEDLIISDPLLKNATKLLKIRNKLDLDILDDLLPDDARISRANGVYNSIDKIMSSGFNRIVLVESDEVELAWPFPFMNKLIEQLNKNKKEGEDLGNELFDLYKENIEYIKYVNPWLQGFREGKKIKNSQVLYEIYSHLAKFRSKSKQIKEFEKFNKQKLYVENTFSLERITLNNLVEKLRFLLFFDLKRDYKNKKNYTILKFYNKFFNERCIREEDNPLHDLNLNDDIIETTKIDELRRIWDSSSDEETRKFLKQNLMEVNNYLSHSLFIFLDLKWEDISKNFAENRITLSSGLNKNKKILDIISYKLSVLLYKLYGDVGYKLVSESFNKKTTKSESKLIKDIKILDAKGFGPIHRLGEVNSEDPDLKEIIETDNNVYNSLLNFKTKTDWDLGYILDREKENMRNLEDYRITKKELQRNRKNFKTLVDRDQWNWYNQNFDINKRSYSTYNLNKKNHNSINYKNENSLVNSQEIKDLCDQFLKETSYYFSELNTIIVDGLDKKISLQSLQTNIENYAVKREMKSSYDKLFHDKDVGEFSPIINTLKKSLIELEICLINFTSNYYINNYKFLIEGMRLGDKKVNFYLLIFVIEAEIDRIKNLRLRRIDEKTYYSKQFKEILVKRVEKIKSIIGIIIVIVAKFVLKYNSEEDIESSWGTISQSNLINKIGYEFINRIPVDFPDNFFEGMDDMPDEDKNYIRKYYSNEFNLVKDTIEFKGKVGSTILDMILNNNLNLLKLNKTETKNKKKNIYISISESYIELLSKKIFTPYKLPMVIIPRKWDKNQKDGGYLTNDFNKFANVSLLHKTYKTNSTSEISDIQIDTINFLNKQKLKINKEILYLLVKEYYNKDSILYNGLNQLHPESKESKIYNKDYSKKVLSHNSKFMLYTQVISIAILYKNLSFYQTTFYDFRGRIYTNSDYFSYQSEDMSKSLIEFEEGCILDDSNIKYVLQYLANLGGNSKLTIQNKEKWSINFINKLNITKHKLNYKKFRIKDVSFKEDFLNIFNIEFLINNELIQEIILNNKDKLQFLVLLFNFIECLINKNKLFCTPISFDATCNGFQHLSAIFKDIEIAKISNVINDSAKPNDVYNFVAENVKSLIEKEPDSDMKDKFLLINFTRHLLKKPVMTIPYNVGLKKLQDQLINDEQNFFELKKEKECIKDKKYIKYFIVNKAICKNNESLQLSYKEFGKLTSFLYKGVFTSFPNLTNYVQYTKKIANIFSALNIPIEWITPAGMKIKMGYTKRKSKSINSLFSKLRLGSVSLPLTKLDPISNRIAFMPNFIHSMDATNIQLLIKRFTDKNKTINLLTTHDCYATSPNYMCDLNKEIRLAFLMIYFNFDYIKSVHENFIKQIYNTTKLIYIKENDKLVKVNIEDTNNLALFLDSNKEYVVLINKKEYTMPSLPYNTKNWKKIKQSFACIESSLYFIN